MKKITIISIFTLFFCSSAIAQTPSQETPKPLELPNFIIEGVEQINVRSGIKQFPQKINQLTKEELDSINSYEKHSSLLLAPDPLPTKTISKQFPALSAKASLGMFLTPELLLGARHKIEGYDLYGYFNYESSSGEYKRSEYNKISLNLYSDYIAPDKFWIFGGSRTRSSVNITSSSYNLYANSIAQTKDGFYDRNALNYGVKVETDGSYEGFLFNTGFDINSLQLSADKKSIEYHNSRKSFDNQVKGYLNIKNFWNDYLISGSILLDFHNVRTKSLNFFEFSGGFSYFTEQLTINGEAGIQTATNSNEKTRGGLLLKAEVEYRIDELMTLKSSFESGLENISFNNIFQRNPYLDFSSKIDYLYNIALLHGSLLFHPSENFFATANLRWRIADRLWYFEETINNTFSIGYDQGTILEIFPEILWYLSKNDKISMNVIFTLSKLNNADGTIPYYPFLKSNISYRKKLFEKLGLDLSFTYVSENDISTNNDKKIDSYLDFSFSTDYLINNNFVFFINFNNLLSSNIYIWNGYKERGLFGKLGVIWQY